MFEVRCKRLEMIHNRLEAVFTLQPCAARLNSLSTYGGQGSTFRFRALMRCEIPQGG